MSEESTRPPLSLPLDPPLACRALQATLDLLPYPAMVFDDTLQLCLTNTLAADQLRLGDPAEQERMGKALREGAHGLWQVTALTHGGLPGACLMTAAPSAGASLGERVAAAATRWRLSRRQREVLELLAKGRSNKEIAETLGCAVSTVEIHVSAVLQKTGNNRRAQLIAQLAGSQSF